MARTYKPIKQSLDEKYRNETPSRNIANAIDRGLGNTIQHNTIADARENTPATPAFERTSKVIGEYTNPSDGGVVVPVDFPFTVRLKINNYFGEEDTVGYYKGSISFVDKYIWPKDVSDVTYTVKRVSDGTVLKEGHLMRTNDVDPNPDAYNDYIGGEPTNLQRVHVYIYGEGTTVPGDYDVVIEKA